jgi:hypothetical protein
VPIELELELWRSDQPQAVGLVDYPLEPAPVGDLGEVDDGAGRLGHGKAVSDGGDSRQSGRAVHENLPLGRGPAVMRDGDLRDTGRVWSELPQHERASMGEHGAAAAP